MAFLGQGQVTPPLARFCNKSCLCRLKRELPFSDNRKISSPTMSTMPYRGSCSPITKLGVAVGLALSVSLGAARAEPSTSNRSVYIDDGDSHAVSVMVETHKLHNQSVFGAKLLNNSKGVLTDLEKEVSSAPFNSSIQQSVNSDKPPLQTENNVVASTSSHRSLGERISDRLRNAGLPDELVIFLLSAMPVVELRAGVPIGFLLGLHPAKVFILAVLGNMAPIIPIMLLLRIKVIQNLAAQVLDRARRKAATMGTPDSRATALALFVGVPLPGTGAWTGSVVAFVLGMPIGQTILSLLAGVIMAACILTILCAMGKGGAVLAGTALFAVGVSSMLRAGSKRELEQGENGVITDERSTSPS